MQLKIKYQKAFEKDVKRSKKRGKDINKLKNIIALLCNDLPLLPQFKDHALIGNYINHRECHIESDWLLIYKKQEQTLFLVRNGSHADLFK